MTYAALTYALRANMEASRQQKALEDLMRRQEAWAAMDEHDRKRYPREIEGEVIKKDSDE